MPAASHTVQIDASIEDVYAVITDYAAYPEFLDSVGTVTVAESSDAGSSLVLLRLLWVDCERWTRAPTPLCAPDLLALDGVELCGGPSNSA